MQINRLGTLVGFSLQVCAGGAAVIWPNDRWIGWVIFTLGSLTLVVSLLWWFLANYRIRQPWIKRSAVSGASQSNEIFYSTTVTALPPSLEKSLYVADIRLTFGELANNRQSELTMRVFNGSGRVVNFGQVSGKIRFNASNNKEPDLMGDLPEPTFGPTSARTAKLLEESLLVLRQPVPAKEADKLIKMLDGDMTILFDLSQLKVEIYPQKEPDKIEALPIWSGVSFKRDFGFGRIIHAKVAITLGAAATSA